MATSGIIDLDDYHGKGFVIIRDAVDRTLCRSMQGRVWTLLQQRYGISASDPSTWTVEDPRGLSALRRAGVFAATATGPVIQGIDEILSDRAWDRPDPWGGALVTFPSSGPWEVPDKGWHIDYPARGNLGPRFGVKVLGLLKDMPSGGGATLLAPGSHHLVRQLTEASHGGDAGNSSAVRRVLRVRGVDFRKDYFEFTGRAGDVLLFDPWLFHAASSNVRATPRMMFEQNVPSASALSLYEG